ncbi:MAG: aminoacyl-tRNA hydrolase [Chloroflexi bacterium]|jgi:PTH1 family peptidyl-tRNA hydrolase|nr:aminoacyl-tRNA hydrolase [Chloroflexota bacterium]
MTESPRPTPLLIIGLGNPGRGYRRNRHNVGFQILDALAEDLAVRFTRVQANALVTDARLEGVRLILAKPQTYMNNAGQSVSSLARFFKLPPEQILAVHDDLDLPLGALRLRPGGGSGGHRGLGSIVEHLGLAEFPRLRFGIGRPPGAMDPADFVLQDFGPQEEDIVSAGLQRAVACIRTFALDGIQAAMTQFNATPE